MSSPVGPYYRAWRLLRVVLALLGLAALAVAALSLTWPGRSPGVPPPDSQLVAVGTLQPPERPAATPTPVAPGAATLPARLIIPKIGVDADVTVKGLGADGAMQSPDGPEDVAWYDFTARPGEGGNAAFSGHLDYHDYGPAVFARLRDLAPGDLVEVRLDDGTLLSYGVTLSVLYPADSAPSQDIVGPTGREMVTLVTCGGTWQGRPRGYSHRLVVRADHL